MLRCNSGVRFVFQFLAVQRLRWRTERLEDRRWTANLARVFAERVMPDLTSRTRVAATCRRAEFAGVQRLLELTGLQGEELAAGAADALFTDPWTRVPFAGPLPRSVAGPPTEHTLRVPDMRRLPLVGRPAICAGNGYHEFTHARALNPQCT
jgi:hypothetical protein